MNKTEFTEVLRKRLAGLPEEEINKSVEFYGEMIDERMEEGLTEEEAVADVGDAGEIAAKIFSESGVSPEEKEASAPNFTENGGMNALEKVFLGLGSPVWLTVVAAVCVAVWAMLAAFYASVIAFAAGALGGVGGAVGYFIGGKAAEGFFILGAGFICAGLAILLFLGAVALTRILFKYTKKIFISIKNAFKT